MNDVMDRVVDLIDRVAKHEHMTRLEALAYNERLANHEIVLARMESGLKQLEDRLIDTIRADGEKIETRLGALEDFSKALRKHWTTMDEMHTISRGKELNITKRSGRCRHRTTRV